ncbi:MAG TPA: hypothetical protein VME17_18790 [Bryobacteraceae bacterium]|nr:hypothetical protein [Bryobacteraceae bacterium]
MLRFALFGFLAVGSAYGAGCDRTCLKATLDQYLNAVVQHNPAEAPLSAGYRQTENALVRRPGTGIWVSAKALGKLQRRYFDTETGEAGYFGTLDEESGPAIVTVRLKIVDRKITEAEWMIARKGDPGIGTGAGAQANAAFFGADYLIEHPPAERVMPRSERLSRGDMVAITNSYFDGLSAHDGSLILAHPGCVRLENGVLTTQRSNPEGGPGALNDCTWKGAMRNIFAVTARRYPIVDEEAGVVLALGVFERKPGVAMRRNLFSEWFLIDQGKIRSIYSSMSYPEQETMVPNWPPYNGNWPVAVPPK